MQKQRETLEEKKYFKNKIPLHRKHTESPVER
jgi:hypothetical protein